MLLKFRRWRLELKLKRIATKEQDERILDLTELLLKEIKASGRSIKGYGELAHVDIYIHKHKDGNELSIENMASEWKVRRKTNITF